MVNSGPFDGEPRRQSIAKVAAWLEQQGTGRPAVTYRLRDWLISRQRYWGAPIPIMHCRTDGVVPVPEEELPVLLPEDVDFRPGGESPLARAPGFVQRRLSALRRPRARGTPTRWTRSSTPSWYFFRYCSPHDEERAFDPQAVARGCRSSQYTGGVEHAILHSALLALLHEGAPRHGAGAGSPSRSRG